MKEIRKQTNEERHSLSQSKSHADKETDIRWPSQAYYVLLLQSNKQSDKIALTQPGKQSIRLTNRYSSLVQSISFLSFFTFPRPIIITSPFLHIPYLK